MSGVVLALLVLIVLLNVAQLAAVVWISRNVAALPPQVDESLEAALASVQGDTDRSMQAELDSILTPRPRAISSPGRKLLRARLAARHRVQ